MNSGFNDPNVRSTTIKILARDIGTVQVQDDSLCLFREKVVQHREHGKIIYILHQLQSE
uniref:Uncharacterized protein n=1 Tax=Solanum tuberosum TaxID=4113 RepID=M1BAY3_SOLTU